MKAKIMLLLLIVIQVGCKDSEGTFEKCPYEPISNYEQNQNKSSKERDFGAEFAIGFEAIVKKISTINIEPKIKSSVKKTSEVLNSSSVVYNNDFVKKWNALVADICGKIRILELPGLSVEKKEKVEKDLIDKVINFYDIVTEKTETKEVIKSKSDNNSDQQEVRSSRPLQNSDDIVFSIQLDSRKTKGFSEVFQGNRIASLLSTSTPLNPRVKLSNQDTISIFKIVTVENDTCEFIVHHQTIRERNGVNRFVPNCF